MSPVAWLNAEAALAVLGVRPQTLYANVSRKRIRAKADPKDPRRSLYHALDVRRVALRRQGRPRDERVAAEAVAWGAPILPSAISTIAHGRLWYRGRDAIALAEHASLEEVAGLLWDRAPIQLPETLAAAGAGELRETPLQAAYRVLALRAGRDAPMFARSIAPLQEEGIEILATLADAVLRAIRDARLEVGARPRQVALHQRLAEAWRRPAAAPLIRRALVLLADHELNASTFATRVAASTGAALSASVLAGFATLSGPLHGGAGAAVLRLIADARRRGADAAVLARLAEGRTVGAFGHPLYPDGDPRARALLEGLKLPSFLSGLRASAERLVGEPPNIDFALAALAVSARLPSDAPFVLFALARSVGWIAHAFEQQQRGTLLRPRARYIGAPLAQA
jgi:citrate synthase